MKKYLIALVLCGCGFTPMFSDNKADIYVPVIEGSGGINNIELRNALNSKFGGQKTPGAPYTLRVSLNAPETKYKALEPTGAATWQEIVLSASYTLSHGDTVISSGTEAASESYTFVRYLVAANASYNNAISNTINVLAEKIGTRAIAEVAEYEQQGVSQK
ncbi:MAG: hypothetical protein K5912_03900 [Alphaproteobacteria bacterium]|nr:hypothetical protein [Alphaproteobacteria bacterium]